MIKCNTRIYEKVKKCIEEEVGKADSECPLYYPKCNTCKKAKKVDFGIRKRV